MRRRVLRCRVAARTTTISLGARRPAPGTGACPDEPIECSKPAAAAGGAASIPVLFKQEERLSRITRMISGDR